MIPDIREIIAGLQDGRYTSEQAQNWLDQHMALSAMSASTDDGLSEYPPLGLATAGGEGDVTWNFPILHFGHGAIEVGDATWQGLHALFIGKDGQGLGVERVRNAPAEDRETLILFTFKNLGGLEALESAMGRVRQKLEQEAAQ